MMGSLSFRKDSMPSIHVYLMTKSSKNRGKNDNDSFVYMTAGGCNAKIFVRRILRYPDHRIAMLLLMLELQ